MSTIAVMGGTGPEGLGLAMRFALGGADVVIGSRAADRAVAAAQKAVERVRAGGGKGSLRGAENEEAVARADIVVLAVPWAGAPALVEALASRLAGKLVIDVINPMEVRDKSFRAAAVAEGSAAEAIQRRLPQSQVVSALKNESADLLGRLDHSMMGDVLVCSDHDSARQRAMELVATIKDLRPVDAGALVNARSVEAITPLLLNLNRRHGALTSIQIVGLESGKRRPS